MRKPGGQQGNQNARIHGYYSKVLDEDERKYYRQAAQFDGLDGEIVLLRVKLKSLIAHDPQNLKLISIAANSLTRMVMTKYNIKKTDTIDFEAGMRNALRDITLPPGFQDMPFFKK
jgi:hypothetical protein